MMMMEIEMICKYCNNEVNNSSALWLQCVECECYIHIKCLKRLTTPGGLSGDVFFIFTCAECSVNNSEVYVRDKMSWFKVIILVLYHLQYISSGTAKQGFFHWKVHIATFIDKKWQILFPKDFKRKKNWMGTVSGSLSHFSPYFLSSGAKILGETGWWRLTYPKLTPLLTVQIYTELISNKKLHFKNIDFESVKELIIKYAPSMIKSNDDVETEMKMEEEQIENHQFPPLLNTDDVDVVTGDEFHFLGMDHCLLQHDYQLNPVFYQSTDLFSDMSAIKEVSPDEIVPPEPPTPSLFSKTTLNDFYQFWDTLGCSASARTQQQKNKNVHLLRANEEKALLDHIARLPEDSGKLRALRRKLIVRQTKRNRGLKLFNIDELIMNNVKGENENNDRFSHYKNILRKCEEIRLASGVTELTDYVVSPYTKRLLKPYIRRDSQPTTHWLTLLNQLKLQVSGQPLQIATLDYCYVRPNYIPAINQLCNQYFWPGIDMSETLEYPDFSCVVLYRKLIVAFAFMVPDVKFNETYISFIFTRPEWRGSGIATFMIYHLINTCMGKDVTLHVAIDNPAICLYQKFGFKVEEVVLNFYDAYLREDSKKCRHAFFLRLAR